jgi:hypothetical protein
MTAAKRDRALDKLRERIREIVGEAELQQAQARYAALEHRRRAPPYAALYEEPPSKRRYSKKIMRWKAAYDALRELGVTIDGD